jgi:hypothetical protein
MYTGGMTRLATLCICRSLGAALDFVSADNCGGLNNGQDALEVPFKIAVALVGTAAVSYTRAIKSQPFSVSRKSLRQRVARQELAHLQNILRGGRVLATLKVDQNWCAVISHEDVSVWFY